MLRKEFFRGLRYPYLLNSSPNKRHDGLNIARAAYGIDPNILKVPPVFPDDSITRHALAVNYSNLIEMDIQMGKIIDRLKKHNLYDNTYIFFYSDHGGPFPRHKRAIYETGTKVPLIVKFPKRFKTEDKRNNDMLSFIDFAPTILSIAGIDIPKIYQGKPFLGAKKSLKKRKYLFTASDRFDELTDRIRAVKSKRFKKRLFLIVGSRSRYQQKALSPPISPG